jgi:DNA polymerase/3'-5' exonuclease PolX
MKLEIPREAGLAAAQRVAAALLEDGCCTRAEIAGSLRRLKPRVGDLEVVAQLAEEFGSGARIGQVLSGLGVQHGLPSKDGKRAPWGPRYYRAALTANGGAVTFPLDLFVVLPPAQWPVIYLIRTGSARFSQAFVTRLHRFGLHTDEGRLLDAAQRLVPVATEEDLFAACHLPYLAPPLRDMDNAATAALFGRVGP